MGQSVTDKIKEKITETLDELLEEGKGTLKGGKSALIDGTKLLQNGLHQLEVFLQKDSLNEKSEKDGHATFPGEESIEELAFASGVTVERMREFLGLVQEPLPKLSIKEREKMRKQLKDSLSDDFEKSIAEMVRYSDDIDASYSDIHLPEETTKAVRTATISFRYPNIEIDGLMAESGVQGVVLWGPPGTGKSHLAKAIAKESRASVIAPSNAELRSKWVGESEKIIKALFTVAKKISPCLIFIDEADGIMGKRKVEDKTWERSFMAQILQEWEGFSTEMDKRIMIIMATNQPWDLDAAIQRRAPTKILVDLPTVEGREAILRIHLRKANLSPDVDLQDLARRAERYSGSDLRELCRAAGRTAVLEMEEAGQLRQFELANPFEMGDYSLSSSSKSQKCRLILEPGHFHKAMKVVKPSTNEDAVLVIQQYSSITKMVSDELGVEASGSAINGDSQSSKVERRPFKPRVPGIP